MSGGEAMDLNGLIERLKSDPIPVVGAILQQVLVQLGQGEAPANNDVKPPEELIGTALGNRLAEMISKRESSSVAQDYEELVVRNSSLAAALGACDCWGQHADCPICDGAGEPGWLLPDKPLFANYVHPAVRAIKGVDASPASRWRKTADHRKEDAQAGDVRAVMRLPEGTGATPASDGRRTVKHREESGDAYDLAG